MARSFAFGSLVAVALFASRAVAQPVSNATCVDQLWSTNSRQQTPCLVSAYLSAQCTSDNTWSVPEIGNEGPYSPPKGDYANLCRCNSVQWNLLSACSMCQGGPAGTWAEWISNCTQSVINIGTYPLPVPAGASVPHWAYYDFTATGVFNAVIASQQSGPESVAVASATSTATTPTTPSGSVTYPIVETPTGTGSSNNNTTTKSSSNTGAIVGGVVGGVLGIALIAVIGFVLARRSKQNKADTPANMQYAQSGYAPSAGAPPGSAAPMMGQYQPGVQHPGMMSPPPGSEYKPYDPSDPSTFPSHNNTAPSMYPESLAYTNHSQPRPGQYNGAPEV